MLESVAISEFVKFLQSYRKPNPPTFLEWLTETPVKLVNIPTREQFWLRELAIAKK